MSFKALSEKIVKLTNSVMGDDVAYTPFGEPPITMKAVFDNAFVEVEGVVSLRPILRIDLNDLDALPAKGDTVEIDSVEYSVQESRLDGFGGSTLILKKT